MKKMFVTVTFKGLENKDEVERLCQLVKEAGWDDFCFVRDIEKYQKIFDDPKELMVRASEEIAKCDALLIDMTDKPTGRAIEAGIAYALKKEVIMICKRGTNIKSASIGIASTVVEYEQIEDIVQVLSMIA